MPRAPVRDAVAVQGLFLLFGFTIAAFFPYLAIYLEGAHGLSESQIGLVIAAMALARLIANPFWGHLADTTLGRLTTLQIGAAGTALAAFAMNLVDGVGALAIAAFFQAAFMVTTGPNVDAIALVHLGDERMSEYGRDPRLGEPHLRGRDVSCSVRSSRWPASAGRCRCTPSPASGS